MEAGGARGGADAVRRGERGLLLCAISGSSNNRPSERLTNDDDSSDRDLVIVVARDLLQTRAFLAQLSLTTARTLSPRRTSRSLPAPRLRLSARASLASWASTTTTRNAKNENCCYYECCQLWSDSKDPPWMEREGEREECPDENTGRIGEKKV